MSYVVILNDVDAENVTFNKRKYRDGRLPHKPGASPMLSFRVEEGLHNELLDVADELGVYSRSELVRLFIRYCLDLHRQGLLESEK